MPSLAFRITGQYKPTNDAAVRASLRDAFAPGAIEDDVECPETHRIVAIRGAFNDTQLMVGSGTFAIRGRFSSRGDVGGCETNKALRMYLAETAQESVGGHRAMVGRPTVALAAMPSSVRNPARKRKAAKRRNPSKPSRPDRDEEAIRKWMPGALKRQSQERSVYEEWHRRALTPGTSEYQRHHAILSNQPQWETLEGQWILRVPGQPIAALPNTGKKSAAKFTVFDVKTRKELAFLRKDEVSGWLTLRAVG